ncbi:hypothetical protein GCM10025867_44680 [Frondihabitans sucicola]|uniref:Type IV secretion protein Rhs n=1 Tax=Frondihabitans sucicola TaxID=1268041 RepID=A0ABM8GUR9_9MICO|nr:hypothetical protein [Frondihabitans sucicola]BDZ52227.1 hypothetical protein GCM10025867_44680 [Frondihabitans sucicola]
MHKVNDRSRGATNPYENARGFWGRVNRFLYPIAGPASLGAGHPEGPYVPPADPACPVCGELMADHTIVRRSDNRSSSLECPRPR